MTDREKLIALMRQVDACICNLCDGGEEPFNHSAEILADHFLANGVTFATDNHVGGNWIPVTERLPDVGVDVLVVKDNGDKNMAVWRLYKTIPNGQPYWEDEVGDGLLLKAATHWMPLPEPPKEGE